VKGAYAFSFTLEAHLAGNGMDVACCGFIILSVRLAFYLFVLFFNVPQQ